MRLREIHQVVTSIEIPLPESSELDNNDEGGGFFNNELLEVSAVWPILNTNFSWQL